MCSFPCVIISCKRTKFSSTDLYWKNSSLLGNDVIHVHVKVKHFILPYRQLINILLLSTLNTFVSCIELTNLNYHYFRIDRNNAIGYMSDIHLSDSPTNILSKMLLILKKIIWFNYSDFGTNYFFKYLLKIICLFNFWSFSDQSSEHSITLVWFTPDLTRKSWYKLHSLVNGLNKTKEVQISTFVL